jgi:hypothetical protein
VGVVVRHLREIAFKRRSEADLIHDRGGIF